jgi:hypothetical protein
MAISNGLYVGQVISTGNAAIATAAAGTQLVVTKPGELKVTFVPAPPKPVFNPGDKVYVKSKGRYARIRTACRPSRRTAKRSSSTSGIRIPRWFASPARAIFRSSNRLLNKRRT